MAAPSTPVTVTTGSNLLVGLSTTSQRAFCPISPTRSPSQDTACGTSPACASRAAMSDSKASFETLGTASRLHPQASATAVTRPDTAAVTVAMVAACPRTDDCRDPNNRLSRQVVDWRK
jgi:hypothetical protein